MTRCTLCLDNKARDGNDTSGHGKITSSPKRSGQSAPVISFAFPLLIKQSKEYTSQALVITLFYFQMLG